MQGVFTCHGQTEWILENSTGGSDCAPFRRSEKRFHLMDEPGSNLCVPLVEWKNVARGKTSASRDLLAERVNPEMIGIDVSGLARVHRTFASRPRHVWSITLAD